MQTKGFVVLGLVGVVFISACTIRTPYYQSASHIETELRPDQIVVRGPTQGSNSSVVFFGFPLAPNSFLEAEQAALATNNSDVLVDRVRYIGAEGIFFPNPLLAGIPTVLIGSQTYYVEGTGAKIVTK